MKKLLVLSALLLSGITALHAQNNTANPPLVRLGKLPPSTLVNGKWSAPTVTRAELQANTTLVVEGSSCQVAEFSVAIQHHNHDLIGPYTVRNSPELTPEIKKILAGLPDDHGTLFIENIRLNCSGNVRAASAIIIKYK